MIIYQAQDNAQQAIIDPGDIGDVGVEAERVEQGHRGWRFAVSVRSNAASGRPLRGSGCDAGHGHDSTNAYDPSQ
jgi:hypothetical protein